jgi:hypothetical protein
MLCIQTLAVHCLNLDMTVTFVKEVRGIGEGGSCSAFQRHLFSPANTLNSKRYVTWNRAHRETASFVCVTRAILWLWCSKSSVRGTDCHLCLLDTAVHLHRCIYRKDVNIHPRNSTSLAIDWSNVQCFHHHTASFLNLMFSTKVLIIAAGCWEKT